MEWIKPLPVASGETKPFWDACKEGKFLIQKCKTCNEYQYHYRAFCSHCWFGEIQDIESKGDGNIWSFTVINRNRSPGFIDDVPYVVAMIEIEGGLKIISNVINCDPWKVYIGMPVKLTFTKATEEWTLPMFEPS
jgi:uncharacterized OB-fold protein